VYLIIKPASSLPLCSSSRQITRFVFDFLDLFINFFCQRFCSDWTHWNEEKAEEWVSFSSLSLPVLVFSAYGSEHCALGSYSYWALAVPESDAVCVPETWYGWHGPSGCSRFQLQQYLLPICFSQLIPSVVRVILSKEDVLRAPLGKGQDVSVKAQQIMASELGLTSWLPSSFEACSRLPNVNVILCRISK